MIAPLSLSNVLTVTLALLCLWTSGFQSSGNIMKLWRLAVPPGLASAVALILLAAVFNPTLAHDSEWLVAVLLGAAVGRSRGWMMRVEADRRTGLVKLPRTYDGLLVAFALLVVSMTDFAGAAREVPIISPAHVAAAAALCAGYLAFRSVAVVIRAMRLPPVEIQDANSVR
jgi:hypothetical protein